eukprot:c17392_g1_i1.p1 GENE.c17392_g1_i1~~c17392_g1_i1.p1  ORF type:complete len:247 (-),score=38.42 c17392_g1_i1:128-868(-)
MVEVTVEVRAENLERGLERVTNLATLWYVAVPEIIVWSRSGLATLGKPRNVPPVTTSEEDARAGAIRYAEMKASRVTEKRERETLATCEPSPRQVPGSAHLVQLMLPSDCTKGGFVFGGVVMKLMDNAAAIAATRHCKSNVVTACIDCVEFVSPVWLGELLVVDAVPTFSSNRSLEVEVVVHAENLSTGAIRNTCRALYTFVSLDTAGKPQALPSLVPEYQVEKFKFEKGRERYLERIEAKRRTKQ